MCIFCGSKAGIEDGEGWTSKANRVWMNGYKREMSIAGRPGIINRKMSDDNGGLEVQIWVLNNKYGR
jgi:hypothetical protein